MVEIFKGSLEVAVDSFNQGGLGVVGGSREMGHPHRKQKSLNILQQKTPALSVTMELGLPYAGKNALSIHSHPAWA